MNLVMNASEAIGERDGVIRVTTECVTVGRDRSEFIAEDLAESDYLRVEVSDTGCGIPLEAQARVFDPFFTTKSAGHGLGLAVVQGIVRSLHGAIRLESKPGKGSTFQILLPCAETTAEATPDASRTVDSAGPPQHATVLVVEDEGPLRQAVSKMLHKSGFSVIEAVDGSAALEAIRGRETPIDVLFLDITLPGTTSLEVLEEGERLRPKMSVIVTSAYAEDLAAASLQRRIEFFIRKPYRVGALVDLIRQSLCSRVST
jgi:CheY-like chemotaxis protein